MPKRPGLRERFVFSQHRYCTNLFWRLFRQGLRIPWPHDFKECYSKDPDTSRYLLSAAFQNRLQDISAWQMTEDLLGQYPELRGDIMAFDSIPASIGLDNEGKERQRLEHVQAGPSKDMMAPLSISPLMTAPPAWGATVDATTRQSSYGQRGSRMLFGIEPDWEPFALPSSSPWSSL